MQKTSLNEALFYFMVHRDKTEEASSMPWIFEDNVGHVVEVSGELSDEQAKLAYADQLIRKGLLTMQKAS
jgi:hypothetical protein